MGLRKHLIFFNFDNFSFWQNIGILIGSDPVPCMSNLFLYYYGHVIYYRINGYKRYTSLQSVSEDLCAIDNHLGFDKNYNDIYHSQLEL